MQYIFLFSFLFSIASAWLIILPFRFISGFSSYSAVFLSSSFFCWLEEKKNCIRKKTVQKDAGWELLELIKKTNTITQKLNSYIIKINQCRKAVQSLHTSWMLIPWKNTCAEHQREATYTILSIANWKDMMHAYRYKHSLPITYTPQTTHGRVVLIFILILISKPLKVGMKKLIQLIKTTNLFLARNTIKIISGVAQSLTMQEQMRLWLKAAQKIDLRRSFGFPKWLIWGKPFPYRRRNKKLKIRFAWKFIKYQKNLGFKFHALIRT